MTAERRREVKRLFLLVVVLAACAAPATTAGLYADVDAPTLLASGDGVDAAWAELVGSAAHVESGSGLGVIPGFEPFNDPQLALSDGRFLVRGRSASDEPIGGWYQRSPAVAGEDNPVVETLAPPVRLFVYDPVGGQLSPVSHVPVLRAYTTAVMQGESPDIPLQVVVLEGEHVVAYTSGFNGAAYDIAYEVWVAPIPEP